MSYLLPPLSLPALCPRLVAQRWPQPPPGTLGRWGALLRAWPAVWGPSSKQGALPRSRLQACSLPPPLSHTIPRAGPCVQGPSPHGPMTSSASYQVFRSSWTSGHLRSWPPQRHHDPRSFCQPCFTCRDLWGGEAQSLQSSSPLPSRQLKKLKVWWSSWKRRQLLSQTRTKRGEGQVLRALRGGRGGWWRGRKAAWRRLPLSWYVTMIWTLWKQEAIAAGKVVKLEKGGWL